jgi:hypothetical protein
MEIVNVRTTEEAHVIVDEFIKELPTTCQAIAIGANKQICKNQTILNQVSLRSAKCVEE